MTNDVTDDARAVEATWDPTRKDMGRALRLVLGSTRYYMAAGIYFVLALPAVALMAITTTTSLGPVVATGWFTLMLYYALANAAFPRMSSRSLWKSNSLVRLRQHVRLDATGVSSTNELASTRLAWAALQVAYEEDHFFVLATRSGPGAGFVLVPKDDLSRDEYVAARELILEKVGSMR